MKLGFCPLASGSSGNSTFIGTNYASILIDAGLSGKTVEAALKQIGAVPVDLSAILITHAHSDHTKGAGILSRRFNLPIYATQGTWDAMSRDIGKISPANINVITPDKYFFIDDLSIKPYKIPHDCNEPVGYSVTVDNYKLVTATDVGHITDNIRQNLKDADVIMIEANHDIDMLVNGTYPYVLKKRILGDTGHLANTATGNLLSEIVSKNLKAVYLAHLSEDNNTPQVAFDTVNQILESNGIRIGEQFNLYVTNRHTVSELTRI